MAKSSELLIVSYAVTIALCYIIFFDFKIYISVISLYFGLYFITVYVMKSTPLKYEILFVIFAWTFLSKIYGNHGCLSLIKLLFALVVSKKLSKCL